MSFKGFLVPTLVIVATLAPSAVQSSESDAAAVTSHIPRIPVQSSALATVGYSKRRHILEIEFINGAVYRYLDVPASVYRDLVSAESKTRYYDRKIKRNYRSFRVRPRVKDQSAN
jgi:KTSC domain